ncbi:MAG: hypothetical protein RI911_151 [Candidatus Parcubacteria bacterium]|jgi:SagB-type dehydrogenase family enzyme
MKYAPLSTIHKLFFKTLRGSFDDVESGNDGVFEKKYTRFLQIPLPFKPPLLDLHDALAFRKSERVSTQRILTKDDIGVLCGLGSRIPGAQRRNYPSGGARYPIEVYFINYDSSELEKGVYHYRSKRHVLENLWGISVKQIYDILPCAWLKSEGAPNISGVFVFVATWARNEDKYRQFAYPLALTECGHIAQNILLAASSLSLRGVPVSGINHDTMTELLGLDPEHETPLYSIIFPHGDTTETRSAQEKQ